MIKLQTVYIPINGDSDLAACYFSQFEEWTHKESIKEVKAFVFTPEELKQVLSNAWNDGRNGTEFTGNFPFTSNRYVNHSPEEYIENFLNK